MVYQKVKGELTDTIIEDLADNLDNCLEYINQTPYSPKLNEGELAFLVELSHLIFYDESVAKDYAEMYNGLQLHRMNPEDIFSEGVGRLLFDQKFAASCRNVPLEDIVECAAIYLADDLYEQISSEKYSTKISPVDEIYLKIVQAVYMKLPLKAGAFAFSYNSLQVDLSSKEKPNPKLKQIEFIGTKFGYGIDLI